ncbi:DNA methyltransferase [Nocardioides sp. InS609-2]|uniref:DNA methyltransferase n=1 Tax=Nocardioides sp. InS609-2 TaxID=2760705 RepID=UPI0020C074DC|nr:DNA methyltransferase [Nocardioides sp. InS609-2]
MPSGEEIQRALAGFVDTWRGYAGTEKSEAQTFLNELFACYGSERRELGARFEHFEQHAGFMDLFWPGICIVEMKAPTVPVATARAQIQRYWTESADFDADVGAARWIVICNFREFEIWEPGRFPTRAVTTFSLSDLPDRYDALAFLSGPTVEPNFTEHYRELTKEAAKTVAETYQALVGRAAAPGPVLQRFILQSVWCMFAEDLGMLDGFPFQSTLNELRREPDRSAAELGLLFRVLNQKGDHNRVGRLAGTRYVNGDLFAKPAEVRLERAEIDLLLTATGFDWRKVDPTIFGSLMEGVLGRDQRWERGAHYTHEVDIMKIVTPTIIRPWRERMAAASTPHEARDVLDELCGFRVLDPSCGCGNFLYVAYRELRGLEHELKERIRSLAREQGLPIPPGPWPFYPLQNLQGIDIEPAAVQIARVTLWMAHRQMIDRYGDAEPPLPLQDLSSIRRADALRTPWPETDCIVGNPPFQGAQHVRRALGDDYVDWLKREFGVGVKDLCTYWFRRAVDHLSPNQRSGLVGTNSISQNRARSASLDYVHERGGVITDAVSSQRWPGDAKVHVSIVNWIQQPTESPALRTLDGVVVEAIGTSLTSITSSDVWKPKPLRTNAGLCFQGPIPGNKYFIVDSAIATGLIAEGDADYASVVRPYLDGDDITSEPTQSAMRWTVDFGVLPLEKASAFPRALAIVRDRAKESSSGLKGLWWRFHRPRPAMRAALADLPRFPATARHSKRYVLTWCTPEVMATDATNVFAFDDDHSMGVLLSKAHEAWAWSRSSTLETRLRYTPTSVFMTFPFPDPVTDEQRERVAEASRALLSRRTEICAGEQIGLTKLYNAVDEGAWADLKALHRELDEAVTDCYGWPSAVAQDTDELVRRLTDLNREISEGGRPYSPFA